MRHVLLAAFVLARVLLGGDHAMNQADGFTGWETPFTTSYGASAGEVLQDVAQARSGRGYFQYWRTATAGLQLQGPTFAEWSGNLNNATRPNLVNPADALGLVRTRFYVRVRQGPTTGNLRLFGITANGGSLQTFQGIGLTSGGGFRLFSFANNAGTTHEGSTSSLTAPANQWVKVDLTCILHNGIPRGLPLTPSGSVHMRAEITLEDDTNAILAYAKTQITLPQTAGNSFDYTDCRMFMREPLNYTNNTFGTPGAYKVDVDDWLCRIASTVETGNQILAVVDGDLTLTPNGSVSGFAADLYVVISPTETRVYKNTSSGSGTQWALSAAIAFPAQTRVGFCQSTGAGAATGWTGAHTRALKNVFNSGSANLTSQTASGAGSQTSFTHESMLETLGSASATIAGIHLYYQGTGGAQVNFQKFLLGGSVLDGLGSNLSARTKAALGAMSHACSISDYTAGTFDSMHWGAQSMHASSNTLYGVCAEVLHDGPAHSLRERGESGFQWKWITWTGDGADRQDLSSAIGFYPHLVMAWPISTTATNAPFVKTIDMPGVFTLGDGIEQGDALERLTDTGLVVGKHCNVSGVKWVALCVRDDGNGAGGRVFGSGSVNGAAAHTFAFSEGNFPIEIVFANQFTGSSSIAAWKTSSVPSTTSYRDNTPSTTAITARGANGITVGAGIATENTATIWWGFVITSQVASRLLYGLIVGQAADAVITPGLADPPYWVMGRGDNASTSFQTAVRFRESEFSTTSCTDWNGGPIALTNAITDIHAVNKTFTVKGNSAYLDNSPLIDFYYIFSVQAFAVFPAPVAADDEYDTAYLTELVVNAAAGVLANDDDMGGDPLTAALDVDVTDGTLALASDGSFTYTPDSGFFGDDTFTYLSVNVDGTESDDPATVTITVAPPAQPTAADDAYATAYHTALVVSAGAGVLANDTLNDDLANCDCVLVSGPDEEEAFALAADGSFSYTPRIGFSGDDTFTYRARNSNHATPSNVATVTITIAEPPRHLIPTTMPLVFARIILTATGSPPVTYVIAETALADDPSWYDGFKPARILRVSPIRRELARDGYRAQTWTLEIADIDRQWREISNTTTIEGAYVELYWVDDAVRRAEGEPVKLTAGLVSTHRALGGFRYELTIEDVLGRRFTEIFQQPMIPFKRLSVSEFPELEDARDGTVLQIGYGSLSDEAAVVPRGVVPAFFVGTSNLSAIGGIDRAVDALILVGHAVKDIIDLYYNLPAWAPEETAEVGDLIHPTPSNENDHKYVATVAGTTGASEPTWPTGPAATVVDGTVTWQEDGSFDPQLRYRVPAAAYDVLLVTPYKPNWTAATSLTVNYVDYNGFRYTPIFVDHVHRAAKMIREGRIILTANLDGIEDVGDGTGELIESAEEFAAHLLANYVFGAWQQGGWLTLPNLESGLPIVDLDSVTAAKAVADARQGSPSVPYRAAVLLGADGQPRTFFDVLADLLVGGDLEVGQNRHGQLFFSREDAAAPAAVSYDAVLDIVDGAFDTNIEREIRTNRVEYSFGERYVTPDAPVAAGREGEPLPASSIETRGQWESGVQYLLDTAAQDAVQRVIVQRLENRVVRDAATATDIAEHVLTRGVGPVASKDGPRTARFSTRWQGLRKGGVDVDLGTVVGVTHPEGLSAAGWTDARVRVRVIEIDAQAGKVTLDGRVLDG